MKWDTYRIMGYFAEHVGGPADNIRANDIFNHVENSIIGNDIIQSRTARVITQQSVAIGLTFGFKEVEQMIDIGPCRGNGLAGKGGEGMAIAAFVVSIGLSSGKHSEAISINLFEPKVESVI
jgi:hypothetical protein